MKHSLITVLSFLAISNAALGQAANAPIVRIDTPNNVAEVNGEPISRSSLAAECLQLHGADELQELINNTLIRLECQRLRISVFPEEIDAEILRKAQTFKMTSEDLLKLLEREKGVSAEQYRQDLTWRTALKKLAGTRLNIDEAELQIAYEQRYGAAVQVRQIVLPSRAEAEEVLAEVKQHPETFPRLAQNKSIDPVSAPFAGMLHPIRRHTYNPGLENILFAMKPEEISPVIEFPPGFFTIYRCEGHLQPHDVDLAVVKADLAYQIGEAKLLQLANEILTDLQNRAQIQIVFDNTALHAQYPGVAAILNGQYIYLQELAEACIRKHGRGVLSDMIDRRIIEQAARRENIIISEQDIDKEIWDLAFKYLPLRENGAANVDLWLKRAQEEMGLSIPMYRKNVVVPMLALKRLTRPYVEVTEADIQRSYEANYGKKVQCLAIFFAAHDQRRAMDVWQMANRNKSEEAFGDLAARYSHDPPSRQGRGVLPPISRHFGHPELEEVVFSLQPGDLSPLIPVEDSFVILYCVGHINPSPMKREDVEVDLIADIFEKKQQIIISRYFERLHEQSDIANYLTGEIQNPGMRRATEERGNLR